MSETPLSVLIVDDNDDHAQLALEFLKLSGPYQVDIADCLEALWEKLAANRYDIALLDHNLPDGTGLDALTRLRTLPDAPPVIMVTGRGDQRVAAQAIQRGAIEYLVKEGDYLQTLPALVEKAVRNYQAIQAARHSLERVHYQAMLLDNVRDAIVVWNTEGTITYWSRSAEALFGRAATTCLGLSAAAAYFGCFDPVVAAPAGESTQTDVERRYWMPGQDRSIWVSSTVTALQDPDGRVTGYMDVCRDITQRKHLESQFKVAQTQLAEATRLAAIGELASGVAHQISNPLTTIIAEAQLLLHQMSPKDENRDSAKAIEQAGWRAQRTIQRLLDFAKPAHGLDDDVSVNATIEHAIHLIGGHIESLGGVSLSTELDSLPSVRGSSRQLEDLWVNLLLMARDATADGRPHQIQVRSRLSGAQVQVEVNDDGALIPSSKLGSIFEPDFEGFENGRGSGLELSLCREIVRQHRGRISVDSDASGGTTFTILLPTEGTNNGTR